MTLPQPPDPIVARACNRGWTNAEVHEARSMWNSPAWKTKEIAHHFGVKYSSFASTRTRQALGLGLRPPCKGSRGRLNIPKHCHPFIRFIFRRMNADLMTFAELGKRSGVDPSTIHHWGRMNPRIHNIEAVLNALGYCLKIVPLEDEKEHAA